MKCLHVADVHYDLLKLDWIVDVAEDVDLIVMAGDHLEISNMVGREAQAVVIKKYFQRIKKKTKLIVSSGNHDLDAKDEFGEQVCKWITTASLLGIPSDGDSVEIEGSLFSVCPWWDGKNAQYDVEEQLARDATHEAGHWVWVHHAPPDESPTSWGGKISYGDECLGKWIKKYQPDLVLSGHIHQSPYINDGSWVDRIGKTWVFNGGHQPGRVPSHVLIDTEDKRAYWKSAYGAETVRLDEPLERPVLPITDAPEWVYFMDRAAIPRQG
ncbi:MAG: metallophosphoesterase family protein [Rhizobiaceae bacterium]